MHKATVAVSYRDKNNYHVENVSYQKKEFFGVMKSEKNKIVFSPMDGRYGNMLLFDIDSKLFKKLKFQSVENDRFSFHMYSEMRLKNSNADLMDLNNKFYKVKLIQWDKNKELPFCKMLEPPEDQLNFGEISDNDILKNVVMLENGFNEDDFPKAVKDQVKKEVSSFESKIKKELEPSPRD